MRRKYSDSIQHTVYKDGWNDALREFRKRLGKPRIYFGGDMGDFDYYPDGIVDAVLTSLDNRGTIVDE